MKHDANKPLLIHLAGGLATAIVTVLLVMLVILPMWQQQRTRSRLSSELATQVSDLERSERGKRLLSTQLAKTNDAADKASLPLKSTSELNEQLAKIADLAAAAGVQIESLAPSAGVNGTKFRVLPIRLSGKGSYRAAHDFFASLKSELPDTSITSFQMRSDNNGSTPAAMISTDLLWCTKLDAAAGNSSAK